MRRRHKIRGSMKNIKVSKKLSMALAFAPPSRDLFASRPPRVIERHGIPPCRGRMRLIEDSAILAHPLTSKSFAID